MSIIGPRKKLGSSVFESSSLHSPKIWAIGLAFSAAALLAGCQAARPAGSEPAEISGSVDGGQQPIAGASIQLYAAGTAGDGSAATPLLSTAVTTSSSGSFNLNGLYQCPTAASEVYLVATGGNPGLSNGATNAQAALMTALGPCGNLTSSTSVEINELTTVAAVYALSPYMQSYTSVGSNAGDAQLMVSGFTMAEELANTATGVAPGVGVPAGQTVPAQKLNTLGDILSACINSAGGLTGGPTPCGLLFSLASAAATAAPANTIDALLDIALNPTSNVVPIFDLNPPTGPFGPAFSSPPSDWTLAITSLTPSPLFSPSPGTYTTLPSVTLSDSNPSAAIYYTTNGSLPTASSTPYTGAITLSGTTTIRAVAIAGGISSMLAAATYALQPPTINLTPTTATLTTSQTQAFTATVSGGSNTGVTWSLSPAVGSISTSGVYTAPATISSAQTVMVTATSAANTSANAVVTLSPLPLVTLSLPSTSIGVGSAVAGSVNLSRPAGAIGVSVSLTSSALSSVTVSPSTVTIAAGQSTGSFMLSAVAAGASTLTASSTNYVPATSQLTATASSIPSTFMGLTVGDYIHLQPTMQFGTTRSWDAGGGSSPVDWSDINPSQGVFNFTPIANYIAFNQTYAAQGIYTFGRTPQWASSQPNNTSSNYASGECAPPSDLSNWDAFVTAIATYAGSSIKYWELWNEPQDPGFYCGDIPTMVTMAQHAYGIIKRINPNALILSPAVTGPQGPAWLTTFLADGGGNYTDIIAFHGYWSATAEDVLSVVARYQTVMQAAGQANKPIWDTEASWAGFGNIGTPTSGQQVAFIPKYYLLQWSQGVSRFMWYSYDGGSLWGGLEANRIQSPAATAYNETYNWLVGASMTQACSQDGSGIWTCALSRSGGYSAEVLWNSTATVNLTVPAQYSLMRNLSGVESPITNHSVSVGNQPLLLETSPLP